MFDRPQFGERAVLVSLATRDYSPDHQEILELATSAGAEPVGVIGGALRATDPRTFVGSGKVVELAEVVAGAAADLVIFNHALTPSQERNLERDLSVRVLDRTGLILDIFAQRARSFEGKLQVELAQLKHLSTRLVRGWTHLERQKGGIGLRGPGETQLETDRRLVAQRIRQIEKRLEKVAVQRGQGRRARQRADVATVSLVGYTNAGKSTLFNALTQSSVLAIDQLFATLDPTLRRVELGGNLNFVLADTVGFIRDLPHELVAAFRSTLQEACESDLLLHVVDASDERFWEKISEVNRVLEQIGAHQCPQLLVFNKIDALDECPELRVDREPQTGLERIWLSARTAIGLELLQSNLAQRLRGGRIRGSVQLEPKDGRWRAKLHDIATVLHDEPDQYGGWRIDFEIAERHLGLIKGMPGFAAVSKSPTGLEASGTI